MLRDEIENSVRDLFNGNETLIQAATVMLLGQGRRRHLDDFIKITGYDRDRVQSIFYNLKINGYWRSDEPYARASRPWDLNTEEGRTCLSIDVLVALGMVRRTWNGQDYVFEKVVLN